MNQLVTLDDKRSFLDWFLDTYELQKKECAWLLTYIKSDDHLLKRVRFVDELLSPQRSIFMSTKCVNQIPFKFSKQAFTTTDVERAFHDIRLNPDDDILIKLSFKDAYSSPQYAGVRELDPCEKYHVSENTWYSLLAEMVLDEALEQYEKARVYDEINHALENKDKERFIELSRYWLELIERENEQEPEQLDDPVTNRCYSFRSFDDT